jgi:uncharacterized protein involved in type VI secretion and phage assembly
MNHQEQPFYGKYQGVVTDNSDPQKRGQLRARVPDVYGEEESDWALPSLPYAGKGVGLYLIPPVGAFVWVEFQHGDPRYPIWTGCFWGENEAPVMAADSKEDVPNKKVLKTDVGAITLNDSSSDGGITIETAKGMKIVINDSGIEITDGQGASIKLTGNKVSINGDALEVE